MILMTHTENSINAGIVATVAHGEPVEHKEHDVDVFPAEINIKLLTMLITTNIPNLANQTHMKMTILTIAIYWLTGGCIMAGGRGICICICICNVFLLPLTG